MQLIFQTLPGLLQSEAAVEGVRSRQHGSVVVPEFAQAVVIAALAISSDRSPIVVAAPTGSQAEVLAADLGVFLGDGQVELFPAWETLPFERLSPTVVTVGQRLQVLNRLSHVGQCPKVVVASGRSLAQILAPGTGANPPICIALGDMIDHTWFVNELVRYGYRREYQVERRGEFAIRGSILDVWPSNALAPVRIDFWGDEVDRLCEFGVSDQRATIDRPDVAILPCREFLPDGYVRSRAAHLLSEHPWGRDQWERLAAGEFFDGMESWLPWLVEKERVLFELLGENSLVVALEPRRVRDRIADLCAEEEDLANVLAKTWGADGFTFPRLHVSWDRLLSGIGVPLWNFEVTSSGSEIAVVSGLGWARGEDGDALASRFASLLSEGYQVILAADGEGSAKRLAEKFGALGVELALVDPGESHLPAGGSIVPVGLQRGFVLPDSRLAVLTEAEATGRRRTRRGTRPRRQAALRVFEDLTPGDFVVHEQHGVARFAGLVRRMLAGVERDYLLLEYRGEDRLYLPTDQIDALRPYTGGERPSLSRMGGTDWQKTRSKVRSAVAEIAQELVVLYQKRISAKGRSFGEDTPWQRELEQSFPYQETPDQLEAIAAIKHDMENSVPMDRLVCGDVGFGKTEVALRAVFKAVQEGAQAAILVPTTLLAQQHGQNFRERFAQFPVRVEVLSRFLSGSDARHVIEGLADGSVDVVVGTHRLLSQDVSFKDLGLLVIDEEQRFGVQHKEAIKQLRSEVDVVTLTATPIPRTLEMSLTGIRDLSLLDTPPADRQPILTYVGEYDEKAVVEAIRRELLREGQVFFVHNRVADIEQIAGGLRELVPEARIAVAHGQMDEALLESVVIDFWEGHYDVLVCTTIIESGIDMPTVNTLVVDRADLLGLGQMHQLRGRVGRAGQRAYAYLFVPSDQVLSEKAYERLRTIGESTELGAGFRIAMRDLEIRGAGNLLGTGQSGHIAAVGYDLYCQMVNEAVAELSGNIPEEVPEVRVEVPIDAHLPDDYVSRSDLRLEAYRKLVNAGNSSDSMILDSVRAEWEDRYGPLPKPAEALVAITRLRSLCIARKIEEVVMANGPGLGGPDRLARCFPVELPLSRQTRLSRVCPHGRYRKASKELYLPLQLGQGSLDLATQISDLLVDIVPVGDSVQGPVAS